MAFSARSVGDVAQLRRAEIVRQVEARLEGKPLSPDQIRRQQDYYNRTLGHIEGLRERQHLWPERLFPRPPEEEAVYGATRPQPQDDAATAELRQEYERLYRSLQREMARAANQSEALGQGCHVMNGGVEVEVAGAEVTTVRPDGSWRCADLSAQTVKLGDDELLRKDGSTLFRHGPAGWERFSVDQDGQARHEAIPRTFRLEVAAPGGVRETLELHCQALPGGDFEVDFKGRGLRGLLEVRLASGLPSPKKALEEALRAHLGAVLTAPEARERPRGQQPVSKAAEEFEVGLKWTVVPAIRLEDPARPTTSPLPMERAEKRVQADRVSISQRTAPPVAAAAPEVKAQLKGQPPAVRVRLENGTRLPTTPKRLRKARKLAAKVLGQKTPQRHTEQVALRLAAFGEQQLEALERHGLQLVVVPPREERRRKIDTNARPLRVPEDLLFETLGEDGSDELLLALLRVLEEL